MKNKGNNPLSIEKQGKGKSLKKQMQNFLINGNKIPFNPVNSYKCLNEERQSKKFKNIENLESQKEKRTNQLQFKSIDDESQS